MPIDYNKGYPQGMVALNDPSTLLLADTERKDWRVNFVIPATSAITFALYPFIKNWFARAPLFTGLYQFPLWFTIGAVGGKIIDDFRNHIYAEKDAHFRQYIRNHPEDFQPEERKKVGDLFKPWTPIR